MAAVTEFAYLPMINGANLEEGGAEHKIMMDAFTTISQQPGCQKIHYATQVEDKDTFMMIIDWDSLDAHRTFTQTDAYGPFLENVGSAMAGPPELNHAALDPHPPDVSNSIGTGKAPATEILTMYFPTSLSEEDQQKVVENLAELDAAMKAGEPNWLGMAGGWVVEELNYDKAPGGKAKAYRAMIGWTSVQAHESCRNKQVFKDNIHLVREAPNIAGLHVFHVNAKTFGSS